MFKKSVPSLGKLPAVCTKTATCNFGGPSKEVWIGLCGWLGEPFAQIEHFGIAFLMGVFHLCSDFQ